jgi:predicted transcriptional regulator
MKAMPGNTEWQRKNRAKKATYRKDKKKCIICGLWYVQVGSHIVQVHKMTAREYREMYDLPVKCGITAEEYKKRKGEVVFKNKTVENLKSGKKNWYSKDDPRAKKNTGWKGRNGSKGYVANEYYG